MSVVLQVACAFVYPSHIGVYAPGDFLTCRFHATRIIQEIKGVNCFAIQSAINGCASRLG
ncbi:hypothetical protein XT66_01285 [Salmonella enterica subsp. salamae]|uniref:Uncharacterized protein n=1 Tax=Salmonella enterica subsp. salamae TaxID=59202 RepID=A0A6C8YED1_SALER|nr:hypothetical protein [Salmonella enterica subsp. salamae]MII80592.1 hypothetical protein [Salmonella enterica subsp. salamae]